MFGIGMGPSNNEKGQYNLLSGIGSFGTSVGEGDINAASGFYNTILGGNQEAISKLLAPQISTIQKQGQQQLQTQAEFGNRSGGTNAGNQNLMDTERANVSNMVSNLTGQAAGNLGSMGTNLLGLGASASEGAFNEAKTMQDQSASKWNDIFKSIGSIGGGILGSIPAGSGSFADVGSNLLAGVA